MTAEAPADRPQSRPRPRPIPVIVLLLALVLAAVLAVRHAYRTPEPALVVTVSAAICETGATVCPRVLVSDVEVTLEEGGRTTTQRTADDGTVRFDPSDTGAAHVSVQVPGRTVESSATLSEGQTVFLEVSLGSYEHNL